MNDLNLARSLTSKKVIFILTNENDVLTEEYKVTGPIVKVPFGQFDKLTYELAMTFGNVAGIVVIPTLYPEKLNVTQLRRVRQLSSAEGAMFIWDESLGEKEFQSLREKVGPDLYLTKNSPPELLQGEWK